VLVLDFAVEYVVDIVPDVAEAVEIDDADALTGNVDVVELVVTFVDEVVNIDEIGVVVESEIWLLVRVKLFVSSSEVEADTIDEVS